MKAVSKKEPVGKKKWKVDNWDELGFKLMNKWILRRIHLNKINKYWNWSIPYHHKKKMFKFMN